MPILHTAKFNIGNVCLDVIYKNCFFSDVEPPALRLHCHLTYEIYCVESGSITINFENNEKRIYAPCVIVIPPKIYHITVDHSPDAVWYSFEFSFSADGIGESFRTFSQLLGGLTGPAFVKMELADATEIRKYENLNEAVAFKIRAMTGTLLINIIDELKKTSPVIAGDADNKKNSFQKELMVAGIIAYMEKNARGPLSLSDVSRHFSFSERQIERLLKEVMHDSFFSLLNKYRIHIATISISAGETNLTRVAEECGFSNYVTFWNHFTKLKGMTPSEYKKRVVHK